MGTRVVIQASPRNTAPTIQLEGLGNCIEADREESQPALTGLASGSINSAWEASWPSVQSPLRVDSKSILLPVR